MLQKEDLDKLTKVDRDRLLEVLSIIEALGIKFPNKVLSETFKKSSGEISTYLNAKKSMPDNFYRDFIKVYGKKEEETINNESHSTEKNSEVLRLLTLTEKITDSHLGLVRSHENLTIDHHKIINQNEYLTKVLEKDIGQKVNLNLFPNDQQVNGTFLRLVAESLADKYSLNQNDLLVEMGRIAVLARVPIKL